MLCTLVVCTGGLDSIEERFDRRLYLASLLLSHTLSPLTRDVTPVPCESYIGRDSLSKTAHLFRTTFAGTQTWVPVNVSERTLGLMRHENVYSCHVADHRRNMRTNCVID
jgi:hypothetical protein